MGGVWLSSFVIALSAALLVNLPRLFPHGASLLLGLVLLLGPWAAGLYLKGHAWTHSAGEPLRVVAIQGNIAQELKWDPNQVRAQLDLYRDLSLPQQDVDLIVWPETAVPILQDMASGYLGAMGQVADEKNAALITGVPVRERLADGKSRYFNGITVVGEGAGTYLKQKLVPFGEYVPLQDLLRGLIAFFDLPMSDFARGPADQPLLKAKGYQIAPYICYEVVYPEFAAALAAQSQVLLTVSNDTWFGTSIGPLQHLQMAQMRALESGRWMIRATNNGVTGLIDPYGRIVRQIPQFQQGILRGEVIPMQGLTPYLQYRVWPLAGLAGVLLLWALLGRQLRPQGDACSAETSPSWKDRRPCGAGCVSAVEQAIADQADRLVQQHAALPEGLRFRQPAAEGPQVGPAEEADRRRDHLEPLALEAPACPLHVPGLGHQHHPAHASLVQLRGAQGGVFPGGTAETFLPARRHAEVLQQGIGHQRRLAGRASVMQPAADQYRQRRGLGQPRGIAQPLGRQQARRIVAPGRVVGLPAGTEDDDGVGALRQAR